MVLPYCPLWLCALRVLRVLRALRALCKRDGDGVAAPLVKQEVRATLRVHDRRVDVPMHPPLAQPAQPLGRRVPGHQHQA
eukprot:scaffold81293_cov60-Phaeocystis_antarctica.AAC.2